MAKASKSATKKSATKKSATKKSATKKSATKSKGSGKRSLIAPKGNKRLVKRDSKGQFKESDDLKKSLGQDVRKKSAAKVKAGYGDKGDQAKK